MWVILFLRAQLCKNSWDDRWVVTCLWGLVSLFDSTNQKQLRSHKLQIPIHCDQMNCSLNLHSSYFQQPGFHLANSLLYLYSCHHKLPHIKLIYSDQLNDLWQIQEQNEPYGMSVCALSLTVFENWNFLWHIYVLTLYYDFVNSTETSITDWNWKAEKKDALIEHHKESRHVHLSNST